ncbi:DedA family protein [Acetobacteraceae bacterium]|nr:DedA family protein [Candidatus Parcubacteria bacterium]
MGILIEHITTMRERAWRWFAERAGSSHAIFWLCVLSYLEPFISPIVPEALMAAMILAKKERWKLYTALTVIFTFFGGVTGYLIGAFLFRGFGDKLLALSGFTEIPDAIQTLVGGNIFLIMFFIAFTLLPDKPFTYLAGFLGLPFASYAAGLFLGRTMRVTLVGYFAARFGGQILELVNRYFFWFAMAVLAIFVVYGTLHLHLLPL